MNDHIVRLRQLGDLGVRRGVVRGFSKEAKTRGFPSPSFGGIGFIGVASDLSIVAGWQIGSLLPTSAFTNSGHSSALEITDMTGRFRPKADCRNSQSARRQ